jgi:hypothetical protein
MTPRMSGRCENRECRRKSQLQPYKGRLLCEWCVWRALRNECKSNGKHTNKIKDEDE